MKNPKISKYSYVYNMGIESIRPGFCSPTIMSAPSFQMGIHQIILPCIVFGGHIG